MKNLLVFLILLYSLVSSAQKSIPDKVELCQLLTQMIKADQSQRIKTPDSFSNNESDYTQKEIDSMNVLQRKIDNRNTEKLIVLTKTYGWLSDERVDCPNLNIWLIFRHAQPKYFEEISELIKKEHQAKRLNDFQYGLIIDHINGRPRG